MGKFEIKKTKNDGFVFNLKAGNGEIIATSETYNSLDACKNGINSVITNAPEAAVEDQTVEGFVTEKNPKFELYTDKNGEFRFRLKAKNGQTIDITLREFELLKFLAMQPDKIFSREKLLENVLYSQRNGNTK